MSANSLSVFDSTLQKSYTWIDDVAESLGTEDRQQAYSALRAVLHALRDRTTVQEATHLGAQLPMLVRGFYFEGWNPARNPDRYKRKEEFLDHVSKKIPNLSVEESERFTNAVFSCLSRHVTDGEIADIKSQLPDDLRKLWQH